MQHPEYDWIQPSMFEGGYPAITVEVTVHLDGPTGKAEVWLMVRTTDTRQLIRMETAAHTASDQAYGAACKAMSDALKTAHARLAPF